MEKEGTVIVVYGGSASPARDGPVPGAVTVIAADAGLDLAHALGLRPELVVGDLALACAVASAHRAAAFEACAALIDDVKETVPIWKEQGFADGSSEWVASLG